MFEHGLNHLLSNEISQAPPTIGELARRAEVTNGTLSNVEQGRVSPSIASLEKILNAIPISMQSFFSDSLDLSPYIYKKEDQHTHISAGGSLSVLTQIKASLSTEGLVSLFRKELSPDTTFTSLDVAHDGMLAGIVVSGLLTLQINSSKYRLKSEEGFRFSLHNEYAFKNQSNEPCVFICVASY